MVNNINFSAFYNIRDYITDFSNEQKIVFVDDRVKNSDLLAIRNAYRGNDLLVRICFSEEPRAVDFYQHSINANLSFGDFEASLKTFIYQVERNEIKIESNTEHLSPKQAEVLSLLLSGMSAGGICSYFSMSVKNIGNYKSILTRKYGCRNFLTFYKCFIAG